jgi:N-acetylmuramoyl-L-alanine amidase
VDPVREEIPFKDSCVQSILFEDLPTDSQLVIQLSDRSWHLQVTRFPAQNVCLLEIYRTPPGTAATGSAAARNGTQRDESRSKTRWRRIILDPGHGGADTGVRLPNNLFEKDLTLLYARRLKTLLQSRLGAEVLLTRNADQELALDERASVAIRAGGELYLSLHIGNSSYAEEWRTCAYVLKVNESSPPAAPTAGTPSLAEKASPPLFQPWEEAQIPSLNLSRRLAEILQGEFNQQMNRGESSLVYRHAPLRLLAPLPMPAVLVEIGNARSLDFAEWIQQTTVQQAFGWAVLTALDKFRNQAESP